ncbi:MAG TPA: hypothetical protein ENI97_10480 [Gammaproteobacteria bacterium]|nr:hypothetical protein [Gammaproteobacteria bacterium]
MQPSPPETPFLEAYRGSFVNLLRWPQLEALWETLRQQADAGWYAYAVGEPPPAAPLSATELRTFIREIDALLRQEHQEDYCGIVYADNPARPQLIKIYDPNNLGVVCGYSEAPPLPGWTLSLDPPCDLQHALPPPANRRRWWHRLWRTAE